jgi:hypothetical protein
VRSVLAPLFGSVRFDPKRHEDVSHSVKGVAPTELLRSKSFAKSGKTCFLLAFIRVFRGLNFGCGGAALGHPWLNRKPSCEFVQFVSQSFLLQRILKHLL